MRWQLKKNSCYSSRLFQEPPALPQTIPVNIQGTQGTYNITSQPCTKFTVNPHLFSYHCGNAAPHCSWHPEVLTCSFLSMTRCSRYLTRALGYFLRQAIILSGLKLFCCSSEGLLVNTWTPTWKKSNLDIMLLEDTSFLYSEHCTSTLWVKSSSKTWWYRNAGSTTWHPQHSAPKRHQGTTNR